MSENENLIEKDLKSIEADLGDDHVTGIFRSLQSDSPRAYTSLLELHKEVSILEIHKYPAFSAVGSSPDTRNLKKMGSENAQNLPFLQFGQTGSTRLKR
ncbi:unnamed protein product [Caenorhabditis auriculariae]|uniref:Uncharacterized protein n=1 Tax=Caenorhabditis auriculariae TaxID=2777116 RepID=A0A8S1H7P7_9PELO|nr:unnamed protein product [Caenorhabditis auriculariae]